MRLPLFALILAAGMSCTLIAGESPVGRSTNTGYRNHPLTIDQAVQLALKQNPSILQQIQQLKVEKGLFYQAQSKLLPQITAAASYSQQDSALTPSRSVGGGRADVDLLAIPAGQPLVIKSDGTTNAQSVPIRGLFSSSSSTALESWQVTLTASQLIWDGGATIASRRAARINEDAAYYTLRDTFHL